VRIRSLKNLGKQRISRMEKALPGPRKNKTIVHMESCELHDLRQKLEIAMLLANEVKCVLHLQQAFI